MDKRLLIYFILLMVLMSCNSKNHIDKYQVNLDSLKTLPDGFYAYRRGNVYYEDADLKKYRAWFKLDEAGDVTTISKLEDFTRSTEDWKTIMFKYAIDTLEHRHRLQAFVRLSRKFRFGHLNIEKNSKISFSYKEGRPEQYVKALHDSTQKIYAAKKDFRLLDNGWFEYVDGM